jgi:hypothetical protein
MKLNFIRTVLLLSAFIVFYTACKKNTVKPIAIKTDVDYKALSSRLAVTFYKSITGQYGGTDVSKGIKSPFSTNAAGHKTIFSTAPLCGFAIDTSYNYTIPDPVRQFDTIHRYQGSFHFVYTCTGGVVNGYHVDDSVRNEVSHYGYFDNVYGVGQHYAVQALDQTFKVVSMNGSLYADVNDVGAFNESGSYFHASYSLAGLVVNFASGTADITAGTTAFHVKYLLNWSIGIPPQYQQPTVYDGTIEYLGDHKAKLTINPGHVYMVDLITGEVTPV